MPAPPVQPIVIWFGRVGDLILLSALRALRARRADPVYVCETDPRKLARIRRLLRFSGTEAVRCVFLAPESSPGDTLDTALPHTSKIAPTHWIDRLVSFGRLTPAAFNAADYPWPAPPPRGAPLLTVSAAARAECAAWLERQGWGERTLILVQPGNRRTMRGRRLRVSAADDKAWPLERWAALLHRIHARLPQAVIVLCGAPRESLLLEWIAAAAQLPAVAAAELPLPRLLALCARAHSMISVDTGPAHAAAALGLPLVVLFGAHSQQQWLPRSPTGSPVSGVGGPPQSNRLDQISVEAVFAAWCALVPAPHAPAADSALRTTAARATAS